MAFLHLGHLYMPLFETYEMLEVKQNEPGEGPNKTCGASALLAPQVPLNAGLWQPPSSRKNEMREPHHTLWGEPSRWTNPMRRRAATWPFITASTIRRYSKDQNDLAPLLGLSKKDKHVTSGVNKPSNKVDIENLRREPETVRPLILPQQPLIYYSANCTTPRAALLTLFEISVPYRHELRVLYNTLPHKPLFKRLLVDIRARDPKFAADQAVAFAPMDPLAMTLAIRASSGRSEQSRLQEKEQVKGKEKGKEKEGEEEEEREKEEEDKAAVKRAHVMLLLHILECLKDGRYTELLQPVRESVQLWERMAGTEI